ncbi:MAG: hypothetical protein FWE61_02365 [Micrococcales bacterium]|nr:hypothetical protein [Micrococcales bacterium]
MPTEIRYLRGDATKPAGEWNTIIAHVCDDTGRWGKGFVYDLANVGRWRVA